MQVAGLLSGGAPVIKKYQVAETFANAGVPATVRVTAEAGVNLGTTTGVVDMVGVTLDTATYSTTQGTGENSAESLVSIVINPDAIIRMRMSGGATDGTDLTAVAVTTASATGTVITTAAEWSSPTYLDGITWGITGTNVGQERILTTVSSTAGTVLVPFDNDTVIGDTYGRAPFSPFRPTGLVQLTTNLTEADASAALATDAEFVCIDMDLRGVSDSLADFIAGDHILNAL